MVSTDGITGSSDFLAIFKLALLQRFNCSQEGGPYETLLGIRQLRSVEEHWREFEVISTTLNEEKEDTLWATFVNGLKPEIRTRVRLGQPNSLIQLIELAPRIEDKNQASDEIKIGPGKQWEANGLGRTNG